MVDCMASRKSVVFLYTLLLYLVMILSLLECMLFLLPSFRQPQGKICKARFCKVYFSWNKLLCGNWLFLFLRNIDTLFFQIQSKLSHSPLLSTLFFIRFSPPSLSLIDTTRFLGLGRDKSYLIFWTEHISHIV